MLPMLADLYRPNAATFPAIAEPKVDGIRATIRVQAGKAISASSREGHDLPALAAASHRLAASIDGACVLDVEVVADAGFADTIHAARTGSSPLSIYPLDLIRDGSPKVVLSDRLSDLDVIVARCRDPRVIRLPRRLVSSDAQAQSAYAGFVAAGFEGAMLKAPGSLYHPGRRTDAWLKMKPCLDMDCIVAGSYEGTGKHAGSLGGLVVVTPSGAVCRVPPGKGIADDDRHSLWARRDTLIGAVVEVTYQEVLASGQLRHARFVRVRTDRSPLTPSIPAAVTAAVAAGAHPVAAWRAERGLSQRGLSQLAGVPGSYIADIERRTKPGSLQTMYKLAKALGVQMEQLLPPEMLE